MSKWNSHRLPEPWGRSIDRSRSVEFTFDGKIYTGYIGDTLASALAANGVFLLARSFKYHRPRGSYTFAGLDANCHVTVNGEPNIQADRILIHQGLVAMGQNVVGSLRYDFAIATMWFSKILPVGFYYRAFFRPRGAWQYWEKIFRRAAGLGKIKTEHDQIGYFDKEYVFADVAVIGAGPAGLSAALAAADAGATVLLVDEGVSLGGSLNYARFGRTAKEVSALRDDLVFRARKHGKIRILTEATCCGWYMDNWLSVHRRRRLYKVRAAQVVLCTGSVEQPAVFRNNDRPGVLPASAVQRLLRLYGVRPGSQATIISSNSEGADVAADLLDAGVTVTAIVDVSESSSLPMFVRDDLKVYRDYVPIEARANRRTSGISGLVIAHVDKPTDEVTIECDLIVTAIGYAPLGQLACHSGGKLKYDDSLHAFRIVDCPEHGQIAGSANHRYALDAVAADGTAAGLQAAQSGSRQHKPVDRPTDNTATLVNHPYPIYAHGKGEEFVDFDEDQTIADLQNAVADGFDHLELAKRYSTVGMGPSQGRLSVTNALRVVQRARSGRFQGVPITTQRPPYRPIPFGVLAGRSLEPQRLTPMHDWHIAHRAQMMPSGLWQRPGYYGDRDSRIAKIHEEVAAVRQCVGLIDVSTLGGVEVRGPDTAEFLNRLYTFSFTKQAINTIRYVLMTDDTGSIVDDGVACRLGSDHFYVTTTTTGSDSVFRTMLKRKLEWQSDVQIIDSTATYGAMNIAGPLARQVIEQLDSDIDFSRGSFPYLAVRQGTIGAIPVLVIRVGFVGELGYELHVPSSRALELWEILVDVGTEVGLKPVGVEAQRVLRLEKGHIIVGQDTDGLTNPEESGLSWAISTKKGYFVGKHAIDYLVRRQALRRLVGFRLQKEEIRMPEECHLVVRDNDIVGRVTSVAWSEELGEVIGLAYVSPELSEPGTRLSIKMSDSSLLSANVAKLPFLDPDNRRQEI